MDDLVAFLRARLDEDEAVARAVEDNSAPWDGQWEADGTDCLRTYNGHVLAYGHRTTDGRDLPIPLRPGIVAHWARHDPARVLREVEAKRNLVDSAAGAVHDRDYWNAQPPSDSKELLKTVAAMEARWSAWHYVLTQLAASYVDHPDYRPELIVPH